MNPRKQQIALAELEGFHHIHSDGPESHPNDLFGYRPGTEPDSAPELIPDYPNNHEAILRLVTNVRIVPLANRDQYVWRLTDVTQRSRMATTGWTNATAKAAQHCEALLKMKGLWEESI